MKLFPSKAVLTLALLALLLAPASAAPKANVKLKLEATLSAELLPPPDAPVGAAGGAEISIKEKNGIQTAELRLSASGLPDGSYHVGGILSDATIIDLGSFQVPNSVAGFEIAIPETVDALDIVSIAIIDSNEAVLLQGDFSISTKFLLYIGNVRVTAPELIEDRVPGAKKVHGHALAHTVIIKDQEKQRKFLFIGFGAAPDSLLTINVDGVEMGTVTATKQGKVKFKVLDDIYLPTVKMVSLTDETGAVIMQADFDPLD